MAQERSPQFKGSMKDRLPRVRLPEMTGELAPRAELLGNIREHRMEKSKRYFS